MTSYLDYNSTAPLHTLAKQEMVKSFDVIGNPSSSHKLGLQARMIVDNARYTVADHFALRQEQVIFTSGGSESNNLIVKSIASKYKGKILVSSLEHPSISEVIKGLVELGFIVDTLKMNEYFSVNLQDLEEKLKSNEYSFLTISLVNSETGIIQNVKQVAQLCKQYNCIVHTDATQAWGKIDFDFNDLEVNLLTLSAHKLGLAKGLGLVLTDGKADLAALIHGGGQERGRRAGTENVHALATLQVLEQVLEDVKSKKQDVESLRDYLEEKVLELNPNAIIVGENSARVHNTSYIITENIDSQTQVINADMNDVCISSGSACSSGKVSASSVILGLGYSHEQANCGVRVSLGSDNTKQDIDKFLTSYHNLILRMDD